MKGWEIKQFSRKQTTPDQGIQFVLLKIEEYGMNNGSFTKCKTHPRGQYYNSTIQYLSRKDFKIQLITDDDPDFSADYIPF